MRCDVEEGGGGMKGRREEALCITGSGETGGVSYEAAAAAADK